MAHTQSLSLLPRTAHSFPFIELRQSLPSKVAAISPFVEQLMRFILKFRSADGTESDIEMALDEALYDLNLPVAERGMNAWNRNFLPEPSSPGKRSRENDSFHGDGRRKIRRTMSTKLSGAQDSIWADITAAPAHRAANNEWEDAQFNEKATVKESFITTRNPEHLAQQDQANSLNTFQKTTGSIFGGTVVYIHLFDAVKVRSLFSNPRYLLT